MLPRFSKVGKRQETVAVKAGQTLSGQRWMRGRQGLLGGGRAENLQGGSGGLARVCTSPAPRFMCGNPAPSLMQWHVEVGPPQWDSCPYEGPEQAGLPSLLSARGEGGGLKPGGGPTALAPGSGCLHMSVVVQDIKKKIRLLGQWSWLGRGRTGSSSMAQHREADLTSQQQARLVTGSGSDTKVEGAHAYVSHVLQRNRTDGLYT